MEMGMGEEERNVDEVWPANYSAGIKGGGGCQGQLVAVSADYSTGCS